MNWFKLVPYTLRAVLYSDSIGKFYHATAPREKRPGLACELKDRYLQLGFDAIKGRNFRGLNRLLREAVEVFNDACIDKDTSKVGVVGEIYLKYNPYAQKYVTDWLISQEIEVIPPVMLDFFVQAFVNREINVSTHIVDSSRSDRIMRFAYKIIKQQITETNKIGSRFKHFVPFHDIFDSAKHGEEIISLNTQFGEGWLLPAEIVTLAKHGVNNVVSLQPFGCIANHIVSQGVFKRIRKSYPELNLLSLDFDSGVSDVNITNRMILFLENVNNK